MSSQVARPSCSGRPRGTATGQAEPSATSLDALTPFDLMPRPELAFRPASFHCTRSRRPPPAPSSLQLPPDQRGPPPGPVSHEQSSGVSDGGGMTSTSAEPRGHRVRGPGTRLVQDPPSHRATRGARAAIQGPSDPVPTKRGLWLSTVTRSGRRPCAATTARRIPASGSGGSHPPSPIGTSRAPLPPRFRVNRTRYD